MRALNKGWIGIALVILFGASLFFFRGSSRYSNLFNSDNFVANVSGTQISTTQFLRSLEMNIGQFAQMIGEELNGEQIRAFQIHQLVLQNLVNNAIFENEFDSKNFILDDTTIAEETKKRFPNLYINNKLNDDALNSFLRQQRIKIDDLVNIINYETRAAVFDNLFFEKDYPIKLTKKINRVDNQKRVIEILKIPYKEINVPDFNPNNITKDNSDLVNYFEQNSNNYMSEETRDISYLIIDKNNYKNNFTPSENEISNYFNNNKDLYTTPEKRSFKQFNFKSKEKANSFKLKITGLDTNQILAFASENEIKFNNFEDVNKNQVLEDLSNIIFSLSINEVSDVITTTLANHIIILDDINDKTVPTLNEVSEKIKNTLTNVQLDNFYNDIKLKINQQILNGLSLNELAIENNLLVKKINNVSKIFDDKNDLETFIVNSAFSQNKDFISDIYDFNESTSVILNVENINISKIQSLNSVYDVVLKDFINSKKLEYANNFFEDNKNDINLKNFNLVFNSNIEKIEIQSNSNELPSILISNIFNADLNEITFASDNYNIYFSKIMNIKIPDDDMNAYQDINILADFKNAFGNEILKTKNISLNDELINGLLSQYK